MRWLPLSYLFSFPPNPCVRLRFQSSASTFSGSDAPSAGVRDACKCFLLATFSSLVARPLREPEGTRFGGVLPTSGARASRRGSCAIARTTGVWLSRHDGKSIAVASTSMSAFVYVQGIGIGDSRPQGQIGLFQDLSLVSAVLCTSRSFLCVYLAKLNLCILPCHPS